MAAWVLSVVGVVCLGVLLDVLLPEGQTGKYVKGVYSLLVVFVIISPLKNFSEQNFKLDFSASEIAVDEESVESFSAWREMVREERIEDYLAENGYEANAVFVEDTSSGEKKYVVEIFLSKNEYGEDSANTLKAKVCKLVAEFLKIDEHSLSVTVTAED